MDSSKPKVIWILGGPGSGKGTQCEALIGKYPDHFYHISTGSLLRQALKEQKPENAEILQLMKQGRMVPSRPLVRLISQKFQRIGNKVTFILDGFPRNEDNLQGWQQEIGNRADVEFLLYFECSEAEMRKRLLKRAETSNRPDDNPETIQKRIKNFKQQTLLMLNNYKQRGGLLVSMNADQAIQGVSRDVETQLRNRKIV